MVAVAVANRRGRVSTVRLMLVLLSFVIEETGLSSTTCCCCCCSEDERGTRGKYQYWSPLDETEHFSSPLLYSRQSELGRVYIIIRRIVARAVICKSKDDEP